MLDKRLEPKREQQLVAVAGLLLLFNSLPLPSALAQVPADRFDSLAVEYGKKISPLLNRYCLDCHDTDTQKGELDLERLADLKTVRTDPEIWLQVLTQIELGEMPPEKKRQPDAEERKALIDWTERYLHAEALGNAGDPGPVVLRRLSNAEYTYTIRDLTGIDSLDPVRAFPVDGAAGEGFTNVGAGLVMSPALLSKYLDAAKDVASHAVLLPDGIRFSEKTTPRDWTDEKLAEIRTFYARFTVPGKPVTIQRPGIDLQEVAAGVIPLEKYFRATLEEREALLSGNKTIAEAAYEHSLNAKYFDTLWKTLNDDTLSFLLDPIRAQWRETRPDDGPALAAAVAEWQGALWRFASVGHIGKKDGPKAWQLPVLPLAISHEIRLKFPGVAGSGKIPLYLVTSDAGDGSEHDVVIWKQPRLEFQDHPPLPLRSVEGLTRQIENLITREGSRSAEYLDAIAAAHAANTPIEEIGRERALNPTLTKHWAAAVKLGRSSRPDITGHFEKKKTGIGGYADLTGWDSGQSTPNLVVNRSTETIEISTFFVPGRGVTMHPSPEKEAIVYWSSPIDGSIRIEGLVADADNKCGNGASWRVEILNRSGIVPVAKGTFENGNRETFQSADPIAVEKGDLVKLTINPRDRNHSCDTTQVDLTLTESAGEKRVWDLASEIVDRIHESNPLADSYGNAGVWHLCASAEDPASEAVIPPGSALAAWRDAVATGRPEVEFRKAAQAVEKAMLSPAAHASEADRALREQLLDWRGPLNWLTLAYETFEAAEESSDIEATAPSVLEFQIPAQLASEAEFVTIAALHPEKGKEASVQMQAQLSKPADTQTLKPGNLQKQGNKRLWSDADRPVASDAPILVTNDSRARARILADIRAFREIFPAALCYSKIVPIDEVVTLTLFHREDEYLRQLMLDDNQAAELDRLWSELRFVSREPLQLVDVFEQLWQYATQDADPSAFEPLREPIRLGAEKFRKELVDAEPAQLTAVLSIAERAWRRPLTDAERKKLRALYARMREQELPHEEAIRLTLARVLVAPDFLYKTEQPTPGEEAAPVSNAELATRLSYFLWSSAPDEELMALATAGKLRDPRTLTAQVRRMLADSRVRRLAIEFGCQWLGVRDFDQLDEKSERHFPEFTDLRWSMHEETIRFFTDLFQNDGSIVSLLDADHTFANRRLAEFYGITNHPGIYHWSRVEGLRARGRGGILGMASTLAKQSGASRTSPILRGNWIYETLLGEHLPRPPQDVPQLPDTVPEGLTERQLIERHSSNPACAKCHSKIDPYGFALENFDAIGRFRAGANTRTQLPGGREIEGLDGLRSYLLEERRDDFVRQFSRKFLGYALGRGVQLSDEPLLDDMLQELAANGYRVQTAIEMIVQSRQFREIRGAKHN